MGVAGFKHLPWAWAAASLVLAAAGADLGASCTYRTHGGAVYKDGRATVFAGANTMQVFGPGNTAELVAGRRMTLVREFVGNVRGQPVDNGHGFAEKVDGSWLHPLAKVLAGNRAHGLATVLDLHRWDGTRGTEFWAKTPSQTPWYAAYNKRLAEVFVPLARARPDVWLSVWNEPFHWAGLDNATGSDWLREMDALVTVVRSAPGGPPLGNVIVVPVMGMGQDESCLLTHGQAYVRTCTRARAHMRAWYGCGFMC